jgi:RNA polymerase sigma-70 factor (ECF subfamily)
VLFRSDLAQDVWLAAWTKRATYRPQEGAGLRAWLYRIAHNRLIDHLRSVRGHPQGRPRGAVLPLPTPETLPRWRAGDLERLVDERPAAALEQVLDRLLLAPALARRTPLQRAVLRARFGEGRPLAETGALIGVSADSVKQYQVRALAALRAALGVPPPPARAAAVVGALARPRRDVCPAGHALAGDNLYVSPRGERACRACKREGERRRRGGAA